MKTESVKIVVGVPESHTADVLEALGNVGAGRISNYSHCSSVVKSIGHFKPLEGDILQLEQWGSWRVLLRIELKRGARPHPPLRRTSYRYLFISK